jgi:hypothetical protein
VEVVWCRSLPGRSAYYPDGGVGEARGGVTGRYGGMRGQLPSLCPEVCAVNPTWEEVGRQGDRRPAAVDCPEGGGVALVSPVASPSRGVGGKQ